MRLESQWSGSRSCCLSHQGFGIPASLMPDIAPSNTSLPSTPCPEMPSSLSCGSIFTWPSSKEGKHLPLYLGMEKNTELTSSKKGWNKAGGIHHPGLADGL